MTCEFNIPPVPSGRGLGCGIEGRDQLALGLVSTMAALVLGLLVSSAKSSYDTERSEVIQMAAKVAFLDRVLATYGPEAADARGRFHERRSATKSPSQSSLG